MVDTTLTSKTFLFGLHEANLYLKNLLETLVIKQWDIPEHWQKSIIFWLETNNAEMHFGFKSVRVW